MTTLVPELFLLPVNPSIESDDAELAPSVGRVGRSDDFMGEGPFASSDGVTSRGGGALRLVRVRFVDGPGPASARGVVSLTFWVEVVLAAGAAAAAALDELSSAWACCVGGVGV